MALALNPKTLTFTPTFSPPIFRRTSATLSPPIFHRTAATLSPLIFHRTAKRSTVIRMSHKTTTPPPARDRAISAVAYALPFIRSLEYGEFLFRPYRKVAELVVGPILPLFAGLQIVSLVAFVALYLGVAEDRRFSRYARLNVMQALALDMLLFVPFVVRKILGLGPGRVLVWSYNLVFGLAALSFVYGFVCSVLGKNVYLPYITEGAAQRL